MSYDDGTSEMLTEDEFDNYNYLPCIDEQSGVTSVSSLTMRAFNKSKVKQTFAYERLGFHGRQEESKRISLAFERVASEQNGQSELILVHSSSGLGKSTLIQNALGKIAESGGYAVSGKFDQLRNVEPFSAIVAAFSDLTDLFMNRYNNHIYDDEDGECKTPEDMPNVQDILGENNIKVLRQLISNLYTDDNDFDSCSISLPGTKALERLSDCCCHFLRTIASSKKPVVVHFDDLQWGDHASLSLIQELINDPKSQHVLFVCSYRHDSGEQTGSHVQNFLQYNFDLPVTTIELDNLSIENVCHMICDLLGLDQETVQPLAQVVMTKTVGNPFFVLRYLESLQASKYIKQSHSKIWSWNIDRIRAESKVALNVADLLLEKIQRLDLNVQNLLKVACCLGFNFDRSLLDAYVAEYPDCIVAPDEKSLSNETVTELLAVTVDEQLLNKKSVRKYSFSHDKIQQVMYEMFPEESEEKGLYHSRLGKLYWDIVDCSSPSAIQRYDTQVFSAAEHFNLCGKAAFVDLIEPAQVAQINLEAARLAKRKAAFHSAATFLAAARKLLHQNGNQWFSNYDLAMSVTVLSAEIEFSRGNFDRCRELATECTTNYGTLQDKLTASSILVDCLGTQGLLTEAMAVGLDALRESGEHIPQKAGTKAILVEYVKTRLLLRGMTDDMLLNLPCVSDKLSLARLKLSSLICHYAPFLGEQKQILVLNLRAMQLSIREGHSSISTTAYAMYGIVESCMGNLNSAARFGALSLKLVEKLGNRCGLHSVPIIRCGLTHWYEKISTSLVPLEEGILEAKEMGDLKSSFYHLQVYLTTAIHSGVPLDRIEPKMREICTGKEDFVHESGLLIMLIKPMWQFVLNLKGCERNKSVLSGEAMQWDQFMEEASNVENLGAMALARIMQMYLAFLFHDHETVLKMCRDLGPIERFLKFHTIHYFYMVFKGCSCFEMFRLSGSVRYRMMGNQCLRKLRQVGNVNSRPFVALLIAERDSLGLAHADLIQFQYDEAICCAEDMDLPHLEAIANERAFLVHIKQRFPCPKEYAANAIRLYSRWGASGKVSQLELKAMSVRSTERSACLRRQNEIERMYSSETTSDPPWA